MKVIVVGSGITGLCAGAILAKIGHEVRVLESHADLIGGHARTMRLIGISFCAGPQFIWDIGDSPEMVGLRVLQFLGLDGEIDMVRLDEDGQDRFYVGDEGFIDVPKGLDRFHEVMVARFPDEQSNLAMFFQYLHSLFEGSRVVLETGAQLPCAGKQSGP